MNGHELGRRAVDARQIPSEGEHALAVEDSKGLPIDPQARDPRPRGRLRALAGAAVGGAVLGSAIAGAWLAGGAAREAVVRGHMDQLAGAAGASGFSSAALATAPTTDRGALAIAHRHDPLAGAPQDPRQRRIAQLIERLGVAHAAASSPAAPPMTALARVAGALHLSLRPALPVLRARFNLAAAAEPFQLRGVVDRTRDLDCLAQAIYYEARGETQAGQAAVAQVVLNRVRHPAFPKSICAVVFQGARSSACQFAFVCNGAMGRPTETLAWRRAEEIAARALNGVVMAEVGEAVSFHAARSPTGWGPGMQKVAQIGAHVFYRFAGRTGSHGMFRALAEPSDTGDTRPILASFVPPAPDLGRAVEHAASVIESAPKDAAPPARPVEPAPTPAADAPIKTQVAPG